MTNEKSGEGKSSPDMFATMGPQLVANPYPIYKRMRDSTPVLWAPGVYGVGAWLLSSYAICGSVLRSKQFGKEPDRVLPPEKLALLPMQNAQTTARTRHNMLFRDPPDHTRLRGLVSQAFTPRTVERLRPRIVEIAGSLIDRVEAAGSMDLVRDFAFPLPIIVIAELLGIPPEDRDRFKEWSTAMLATVNPRSTPEDMMNARRAVDALDEYLSGVIEERRREPRADLITDLLAAHEAGDKLSMPELLGTCRLLLTAGHETTASLIGNGMLALLRAPAEREALAADTSMLPGAVEELLRYDSPIQMMIRFAFEDVELGPSAVKRGDLVVVLFGAANHDPAQFPDPSRLDIKRENAHTHLALGAGSHFCLGAPLARLEGEIAIGALLRRLPRLALATEEVTWRNNILVRGLASLPVTF